MPGLAGAGYRNENPDEVRQGLRTIGALPLKAARAPYVWIRLEKLKREPCDQKRVGDLAAGIQTQPWD